MLMQSLTEQKYRKQKGSNLNEEDRYVADGGYVGRYRDRESRPPKISLNVRNIIKTDY